MYKVKVIIVNYKTPDMVINCIETIYAYDQIGNIQTVIVDNHSNDNSVEQIQKWIDSKELKNIKIIKSAFNGGFSFGNNIGINDSKCDSYLLLNSDTLLRKDAIQKLFQTLQSEPEIGIASPRLEWPDGSAQESCFKFPKPISEFLNAAQTNIFSKLFSNYIIAEPIQTDLKSCEWTSFACVLIKSEVFESIGLLDEGYFMYYEDIDFCYKAIKSGWEIINNPNARVVHLRGGSSDVKSNTQSKQRLPKYFYESRTRYYYKAYGWSGLLLANLGWTAGNIISVIRYALGNKEKKSIDRKWLDIWSNFFNPLKDYTHPEK